MNTRVGGCFVLALSVFANAAVASFHTFRIDLIYSNADGTVQYVVLHESFGASGQNLLGVHSLQTTPQGGATTNYPFVTNLPNTNTAGKRVLIATPGFAALGLVTPDYVFADGFVPFPAGTINYAGVDQVTYTDLPTDGVNALDHSGAIVPNVATNFAGQSGSVSNTCGAALYPFPYTDVSAVGAAFCPGIMEAYVTGISKGTTPTTFGPNDDVIRLQMTTFLQRSIDQGLVRGSRRTALGQSWIPQNTTSMQTIPVLGAPDFCAPDGKNIWVTNGSTVTQVRANTGAVLGTWTGASGGQGVLVAAGKVFVAGQTVPGMLYVLDPTQGPGAVTVAAATLGQDPIGIAFDGTHIWTANSSGSVSIITPQAVTPYPVTTVSTGFTTPEGIVYDGAHIWVSDLIAGTLLKLDPSGTILLSTSVGLAPRNPGFDGTNIWVPNSGDNSITVIQPGTGSVVATILADANNKLSGPTSASFDGERILITNGDGSVTLFKAADLSFIANVSTGASTAPRGACSDGINFWVTLQGTGNLLRF
jgi:YVTN family beta-propeller protein